MNKAITALVVIQVICLVSVLIVAWAWYKKKHPPLCDGCENLNKKERGLGIWEKRYNCTRRYHDFNNPPKICRMYKPRKEDTDG